MMDEDDEMDEILASVPIPEPDSEEPAGTCRQGGGDGGGSGGTAGYGGDDEATPGTSSSTASSVGDLGSGEGGSAPGSKGASKGISILVNPRQRGNPVLKHIRSVPWEYSEIVPDYVVGSTTCALFLSVRYYNLHPDYIHERLKELKQTYRLRILLVMIDVPDPYPILKTLTHIGMLADLTVIPCHSPEDAGRILETYKIYENKPPDMIQEKQDSSSRQQVMDALTSIRSVNKTDAVTLLSSFGSLAKLIDAEPFRIGLCPGIGPQKAQRIHAALHESFKNRI